MARVAHRLAPLVSEGMPERMVVLDSEASCELRAGAEVQRFALAHAEYCRVAGAGDLIVHDRVDYDEPRRLWQDVAAWTRSRHRTLVWAHNLAYDLRLTRSLIELPAIGFELRGIVLGRTSSWARFRGGDRSLLCVDLMAWLPASLANIAQDLGEDRPAFAFAVADRAQLRQRCRRDVEITRHAVAELLHLVRGQNLGPMRQTGAGQSHAAWRKRWLTHRPLVHDDAEALERERTAMWTGRCEAWRWGKVAPPAVVEYDLRLAYPSIAAGSQVPHALVGRIERPSPRQLARHLRRYAVLAEVEVQTDLPLVPCSRERGYAWPVGSFATTLWCPELRLLLGHGAEVRVRRAWLYVTAPTLRDVSRWLLDQLAGAGEVSSAVQLRALKHFARTVIGRCALRYRSWEPFARLPDADLRAGELHDLVSGERFETLHVGHEYLTLGDEVDAEDSLPQITGWIASECRRRLWMLMLAAGLDELVYVDTDSLIVTAAGARRLDDRIDAGGAWTLQRKTTHRQLEVLGPRQLIMGGQRRVAGVPLTATEVAPHEFAGEFWRGLQESLARREGDAVVVERRHWRLDAVDNRRIHEPGGSTRPHEVG